MNRLGLHVSFFLVALGASALFLTGCGGDDGGTGRGGDPDSGPLPDTGMPDTGMPDGETPPDPRHERYPLTETHSPITEKVRANLLEIKAKATRSNAKFVKVGDSITVNTNFFACFTGGSEDFAGRTALEETVDYFAASDISGANPFARVSAAAAVGWGAEDPLLGATSPLSAELTAGNPRFAVVMLGTNDFAGGLDEYSERMTAIVDQLIAYGTVPILSTIPPLKTVAGATWVPRANLILRGIAEGRQIPLVDYHREMDMLTDDGIGGDDIHPTVYTNSGAKGCVLTETGLDFGYNVRNLVTLEALDRAKRVTVDTDDAPDEAELYLEGKGTQIDPYVIPATLPFVHMGSTATSTEDKIDSYPSCHDNNQDESGPEVYYKLVVAVETPVRVFVLDPKDLTTDVDIHVLDGDTTAASCVERNDVEVATVLDPGTWYFSVDTFVDGAVEKKGEYLLLVMPDPG